MKSRGDLVQDKQYFSVHHRYNVHIAPGGHQHHQASVATSGHRMTLAYIYMSMPIYRYIIRIN